MIAEELVPNSESEVCEAVMAAGAAASCLHIRGGGTRHAMANAEGKRLSISGLNGITLYEPAELVLSAQAGTPVARIEAELDSKNQRLAFEPPDYRDLLGTEGEPTIGGCVAVNASGPRRVNAGACRDGLIGVRMVTGRGEIVRSGGRVMKNVTGYDLVKLSAGAHGTLGVLTEVTFKLLPKPQTQASLVLRGLSVARAIEAMLTALRSPYEVTGAAHLPAGQGREGATYLRLEGFDFSVQHRSRELVRVLTPFGEAERLDELGSAAVWRDIRDARAFQVPPGDVVWRVSTRASQAAALAAHLSGIAKAAAFDWGGALIWLTCALDGDGGQAAIRGALRAVGGHATLARAPAEMRMRLDTFEPLPDALMNLTGKIKQAFDPQGILNPGRMYTTI